MVDALIELGRYDEASDGGRSPRGQSADLTSLARLSYVRELHGDLPGALDAMQRAAAAPGLAPENTAFALALVGQLEQQNGHPATGPRGLRGRPPPRARSTRPPSPASAGSRSRPATSMRPGDQFERAVEILPLPEYVIALGETLEAAGNATDARRQYDLARAQIALLEAGGVVVDLDLALFEADHGDAATALVLAEAAYAATPTVRAADALGWALHRAGRDDEAWERAQEALRLGSPRPALPLPRRGHRRWPAATRATARRHLEQALEPTPGSRRPTPPRRAGSSPKLGS